MIRLSNRPIPEQRQQPAQVHYVDRVKEVSVPQVIETHTEHRVEVPVDRIVEVEKLVHVEAEKVNLEPIYDKLMELEGRLQITAHSKNQFIEKASTELNMQSRALVAIKAQRDIDRSRRLMLMKRMKKEHKDHKKQILILKLAMVASLLISIVSLIVKL